MTPLDFETGVFTERRLRQIALSLKRSALASHKRKAKPLHSHVHAQLPYRGGSGLTAERHRVLNKAKAELLTVFDREKLILGAPLADGEQSSELFMEASLMPRQIATLTLADAREIIAAGEKQAQEIGIPYNLAVVDAGGALVSHARMDGAWLGSIDISIHKAFTSRAFDMATEDLAKMAQSGKPLFGINSTNHEKIVIFAGGMPVKLGGQ